MPPNLSIRPPLLNSACPWATTQDDLAALLRCASTGAITTRTSLVEGFAHDPSVHQYAFFDPVSGKQAGSSSSSSSSCCAVGSVNSFGYSPLPLDEYLSMLRRLGKTLPPDLHYKTVIVSVTGTPRSVKECHARIVAASSDIPFPLAMEINLSCPNIPGASPPAYSASSLRNYLDELPIHSATTTSIPIGLKLPPYTYAEQFTSLFSALDEPRGPRISFLTATNTLGSCMVFDNDAAGPVLPLSGLGGLAGPGIHPLALGNVASLRKGLDEREALKGIAVIGVGGVQDGDGYKRMRRAGAEAVGLATGLGRLGPEVFEMIERDIKSAW